MDEWLNLAGMGLVDGLAIGGFMLLVGFFASVGWHFAKRLIG